MSIHAILYDVLKGNGIKYTEHANMHTKRDRRSEGSFVNGLCFVFIGGRSDKKREAAFIVALDYTVWTFL